MFHQTPEVHQGRCADEVTFYGWIFTPPPPETEGMSPWKGDHALKEMSSFPTSNFQENMLGFQGGYHLLFLIYTLRIMGSQVTSRLEIQKPLQKKTSKPLFLGWVARDS